MSLVVSQEFLGLDDAWIVEQKVGIELFHLVVFLIHLAGFMDVALEVSAHAHYVLAHSHFRLTITVILLVAWHALAHLLGEELAMADSVRVNAHLDLLVLVHVMHWILASVHLHRTLTKSE